MQYTSQVIHRYPVEIMEEHILLSITLLLSIINATYAPKPETKEIIPKLAIPTDVDLLAPLEQNEILPLLLIQPLQPFRQNILQAPESIALLKVKNGRMISGTQFHVDPRDNQIFFCPSKLPGKNCLVPQEFKKSQPLQCDKPAIPMTPTPMYLCGKNNIGELFSFMYKGYNYSTEKFIIYKYCHDNRKHKTLFTQHNILSPLILDQQLMKQEREVKFGTMSDHFGINDDFSAHQEALFRGHTEINTDNFPYVIQKLLPSEDMAFALWKKPTTHYKNSELQHRNLVKLWDEINDLIRIDATRLHFNTNYEIFTGVFNLPEEDSLNDSTQLSNLWIKMITSTFPTERRLGIVIIMDNFINPKSNVDQTTQLDRKENPPKGRFCSDDLCDETIRQKFIEVGSRLNCCPVSDEIQLLFSTVYDIDGILRIANLIQS